MNRHMKFAIVLVLMMMLSPCIGQDSRETTSMNENFMGNITVETDQEYNPSTQAPAHHFLWLSETELFPAFRTGVTGVEGEALCGPDGKDEVWFPSPPYPELDEYNCPQLLTEEGVLVQYVSSDYPYHLVGVGGEMQILEGGELVKTSATLDSLTEYSIPVYYWRARVRLVPDAGLEYVPYIQLRTGGYDN